MSTAAGTKIAISDVAVGKPWSEFTKTLVDGLTFVELLEDTVISTGERGIDTQMGSLQSLQTGLETDKPTTAKVLSFTVMLNPETNDTAMADGGVISSRTREINNTKHNQLVCMRITRPNGVVEAFDAYLTSWKESAGTISDPSTIEISCAPNMQPFIVV